MAELDYEYLAGLVKKAQEGNSDAFAEIYAATYQRQYLFAYQYIKDAYLAQDILQEVYILAFKNIQRLHNAKLFVSWINQINFRVCFNTYQSHRKHEQELNTNLDQQVDTALKKDLVNGPEQLFAKKIASEHIMEQILSLPSHESQAIIMRYYNDMKLEEIASAMDCSRSSVKRHLAQGRKKLEKLLAEQKGELHHE